MINAITFDFSAVDADAWTIFITGYVIVFTALISLSLLFRFLPKVINFKPKKNNKTKVETENKENQKEKVSQEVYAAIALAVSIHKGKVHDEESYVLTIDRDRAMQSPWGSKIN